MADSGEGIVSIERVFGRAFGSMAKNAPLFLGAIFGLGLLPLMMAAVLFASLFSAPFPTPAIAVAILIGAAIFLALYSLVAACVIHATVIRGQERRASFGECVEIAFRRLVPLMIVSILSWLAILAGLSLLLVPGLILATIWAVVIPVSVEEDVGILRAFGRAAELTRGARWKVFGIALLKFVIVLLFSLLVNVVAGLFGANTGGSTGGAIAAEILRLIASLIQTTFWIAMQGALYLELREAKEGPGMNRLDEIFE